MFLLLSSFIPLIPGLIQTGLATYDAYTQVKKLIDEDRSMTPEERASLEIMISARNAVLNDTSKDV